MLQMPTWQHHLVKPFSDGIFKNNLAYTYNKYMYMPGGF